MRIKNFDEETKILYLVATPIGNMKEMSPRALEILNSVSVIGCEDTRVSKQLLNYFQINKTLISCHEHNEEQASNLLLEYLERGENIAYMSDAGYPGISDPGHRLLLKALNNGYKVSVISGPSAFLNALIGSGLDTTHFYFHGFLASKQSARIKELNKLKEKEETLIFYESPHRISSTLKDMLDALGNRKATIARELTKRFEEFIREDLRSLCEIDPETLKGEMVIIVEGNNEEISIELDDIINYAKELVNNGKSKKEAAKEASNKFNFSKNIIYQELIK